MFRNILTFSKISETNIKIFVLRPTRQDVKYCSAREFNVAFQFYRVQTSGHVSLLVRSLGSIFAALSCPVYVPPPGLLSRTAAGNRAQSLARKASCYCRIGSASSQFPERFSFPRIENCIMNNRSNEG